MIPEHYARDIVERCDSLIESLLPRTHLTNA